MVTLDQQLSDVFQKYRTLNKRLVPDLVRQKSGDLAFQMYFGSKRRASTKARIEKDVMRYGWGAYAPKGFRQNPEFKRKPGEKNGDLALARFEQALIKLRCSGIAFIAAGWLKAARKMGSEGSGANVRIDTARGSATFKQMQNAASCVLTNYTPGVETLTARYGIAGTAIREVIKDMQKYIDAKMRTGSGKTAGGRF